MPNVLFSNCSNLLASLYSLQEINVPSYRAHVHTHSAAFLLRTLLVNWESIMTDELPTYLLNNNQVLVLNKALDAPIRYLYDKIQIFISTNEQGL